MNWNPAWPTLDFYLWRRSKQIVYKENLLNNARVLKNRIREAVAFLRFAEIRISYKRLSVKIELYAKRGSGSIC